MQIYGQNMVNMNISASDAFFNLQSEPEIPG